MPRPQTVFSELQIALAMVDEDWSRIKNVDRESKSLYQEELRRRLSSDKKSVDELKRTGGKIKKWLSTRKVPSNFSVTWTGKEKLKEYGAVGHDLHVDSLDLRISVKENAQLFQNPSPFKVFEKWPKGIFEQSRDSDWFIHTAPEELNNYYLKCSGAKFSGYKDITSYYQNVGGKGERKKFSTYVADLHSSSNSVVLSAYDLLCRKVSNKSAEIFNSNIASSLTGGNKQLSNNKSLAKLFAFYFRLDSNRYTLCGTENSTSFAVEVSDLKNWEENFEISGVKAEALTRGQPEVLLSFEFLDKKSQKKFSRKIRSEVRWSHGKFCGNPEAKLYKHDSWSYSDLPWAMSV